MKERPMTETNTVSPLRQRIIEDMAARKLNPHTQRSHISSPHYASRVGGSSLSD